MAESKQLFEDVEFIGITVLIRMQIIRKIKHILPCGIVVKIANKLTSEFNHRQKSKLPEISKTLPAKATSLIFRKTQNSNHNLTKFIGLPTTLILLRSFAVRCPIFQC